MQEHKAFGIFKKKDAMHACLLACACLGTPPEGGGGSGDAAVLCCALVLCLYMLKPKVGVEQKRGCTWWSIADVLPGRECCLEAGEGAIGRRIRRILREDRPCLHFPKVCLTCHADCKGFCTIQDNREGRLCTIKPDKTADMMLHYSQVQLNWQRGAHIWH